MDLSIHRREVAQSLSTLEARIASLVDTLAHQTVTSEIEPNDDGSPIRRVCEAYSAIDYGMDDAVGTSVVCLGVIAANADILRRAEAVNDAKARFRAICTPLHHIRVRIPVKGEPTETRAIASIRVILRNIQRSDLNLLAGYRKIPILNIPPASITYTRANTRSVYRKSLDEIDQLLQNLEGPAAIADRVRLESLDRKETHLALVKQHYKNIRANVLFTRLDPRGRGRIQISAELPILYAKGRRTEPPVVRFPAPADTPPRSRARQPQLEPTPFLRSIPVFRYST